MTRPDDANLRGEDPRGVPHTLFFATPQVKVWTGDFGREYTDRNTFDIDALDSLYMKNYGITRTAINEEFLREIPKSASVLEVGCNAGNQLLLLQKMGYLSLSGIEIQGYAIEIMRSRTQNIRLRQASVHSIPYPDDSFDLVFTSGVLIHIAPRDLPAAMDEIHRCARRFIWGTEYYAPHLTEVNYRDHSSLLWKMDYAKAFLERFDDLELVRERRLRYLHGTNTDTVFLLQKKHAQPGDGHPAFLGGAIP
jgi:pseudaminic acid biosynthesis-associated methylase